MKPPVKLFVQLPSGSEYPVQSIGFAKDGTVARITTFVFDGRLLGMWYDLHGADLSRCRLIARAPDIEYWSKCPDEPTTTTTDRTPDSV